MFGAGGALADPTSIYLLGSNAILLVILAIASTPYPAKLIAGVRDRLNSKQKQLCFTVAESIFFCAVILLSTAYLVDASYNPFLYFRF